jgi:PAS domain S-box-containing protein
MLDDVNGKAFTALATGGVGMKTLTSSGIGEAIDLAAIRPRVSELERDELEELLACQRLVAGRNITRNIVRQSKDAVYISTRDSRFVDVNEPFLDLLGYSADDLIGEDVGRICVDPHEGLYLRKEVEQKGYVIDYRIRLQKKDGTELPCVVTSTVRWYNDDSILGNQPVFKSWVRKAGQ